MNWLYLINISISHSGSGDPIYSCLGLTFIPQNTKRSEHFHRNCNLFVCLGDKFLARGDALVPAGENHRAYGPPMMWLDVT